MATISLRLDPRCLENPDLDIRYVLPDLLAERSAGVLSDDGYDYVNDSNYLLLFLKTSDAVTGLACVFDVIENERVLGNDLRKAVVVEIQQGGAMKTVYPKNQVAF